MQLTAALDVGYLADAVGQVEQSCAVETAVRQNTKTKPYPFWHAQPVEIT